MAVGKVQLVTREPYPFEDGVEIPRRVATCPYCDASLSAYATEWEELRSGRMAVAGIETGCGDEPGVCTDEWEDWWEVHRQMPYVYQLPVDLRILAWMRRPEVARRYASEAPA